MLFRFPYIIPSDKTQMVAYLICPSIQEVNGLADLFSLPDEEPYDGRDPELMENKDNGSGNTKDDDQCS